MSEAQDDDIEASRAPLIDHLIELRARLIRVFIAFFVMFMICFYFSTPIYNFLVQPYVHAVGSPEKAHMIYTALFEMFQVKILVGAFAAGFLSFPVIAVQIYKFVAPGLYKNERNAFLPYLIATPTLFVIGACVVYYIAMPLVIAFNLGFQQQATGSDPSIVFTPKVLDFLSTIMTLIFAFGLCFQLPVVLTLLARIGVVSGAFLRERRRFAIVFIVIAAAIFTPPDFWSMIALVIPMLILYEVSVFCVDFVEKQREADRVRREAEDT